MTFERIALDTLKVDALRLITFASQSIAVAFVREAISTTPDENGLLLSGVRMDDKSAVPAFRRAVCTVAGMPRTVAHVKGSTWKVKSGAKKGQTRTAKSDIFKAYNTADFVAACDKLSVSLVADTTTVTSVTKDGHTVNTATYVLQSTKPLPTPADAS